MKVFAISDLHLSVNNPKPMDIFGPVWQGYLDKIFQDWKQKVSEEDVVLLCGDLSWAMNIEQVKEDFKLLETLIKETDKPVVLEGRIWEPWQVEKAFDLGAHCVVIGSAITRPNVITKRFVRRYNL